MNSQEMNAAVSHRLQDGSFDDHDWIATGLEAALQFVASIFPLPDLLTSGTVTFAADEQSHAMPTDYSWNPHSAWNTTDDLEVTIWPTFKNMFAEYGYTTSKYDSNKDVAIDGDTMYLPQQALSEQVIKLWYQKPCPTLASDPTCAVIPAHLHEEVLVNRVVDKAYILIEDGMVEKKANWEFSRSEFLGGLKLLREWFPNVGRETAYIKRNKFRI